MRPSLILVLIVGCGGEPDTDTDTDVPADTDTTPEGPACEEAIALTHGEGGCFGSDYQWEFKADVAGCAEEVVLNVWRTDGEPWDEQHPLGVLDEGPDRVWQAWYRLLTHGASEDSWEAGATSAFDCAADAGKVTFAVRAFDGSGALRACAVWGHDPDRVVGGDASAIHSDPPAGFASCEIQAW